MKQLNEKLFKNTKLIKILKQKANVLDMILKQFPHVSNETASDYVTLQNTAKAPMTIETIPQTSQETTSGKNLLKITNDTDFVNHGVTTKMSDGNLSVSGASDTIWANITRVVFLDKELPVGTYTFSIDKAINCDLVIRLIGDNTNGYQITKNSTSKTFTTTEIKDRFYLFIQNLTAEEQINFEFKLQLELGSEATSYEPYTNGPAPNPDFPMDIHCTTGETQVKVVGKNLFDENSVSFITGILDDNGNNTGSTTSHYTNNFYPVEPNKDYTLSGRLVVGTSQSRIYFYNENKEWISRSSQLAGDSITFQTPSNCHFIRLQVIFENNLDSGNIQLEQSSSASSYLPYEEKTYPISLGNKELYNIYGVYDGFVYDETTDKFYFRRWNRKIELPIADMNNSENYPGWTSVSQFKADYPSGNDSLFNLGIHYFSNICKQTEEANDYFGYNSTGNGLLFLRRNRWGTDYTQTYWKTNYPNLIVDLVYNLKTYVDEEITDTTLISQLRAIKDALSIQSTTHIISTATGENLPFLIKASAVKSFE